MSWNLIIHFHDKEVKSKEIGIYDTLNDAEEKISELEKFGWNVEAPIGGFNRYYHYPPHAILKYVIEEIKSE